MNWILYFDLIVFVLTTSFWRALPVEFSMGGNYQHEYSWPSVLMTILKIPFSGVAVALLIFFVTLPIIWWLSKSNNIVKLYVPSSHFWNKAAFILVGIALVEYTVTNYYFLDHMPHVPDSVAYLTQAKIFASGKVFLTSIPFDWHFPLQLVHFQGRYFSQYNFGHPLLLAIGVLVHIPWIVPPIVGALCIAMTYLVGKTLYSNRIGFLAAFFMFVSPFVKMNASNFMSHNSAQLFTLLATYLFIKAAQTKHWAYALLTGLAFGFLCNIRPYTAFWILIPFCAIALFYRFRKNPSVPKLTLWWLAGMAFMMISYLAYNVLLTGNPLVSPYNVGYLSQFGFGPGRTIGGGLMDIYTNMFLLDRVLLGWPFGLSWIFFLIFLFFKKKTKWEYLFLGIIVALPLGYFFYQGSWMMYGPRFWYEMTPFLILVIVLGIEQMPQIYRSVFHNADWIRQIDTRKLLLIPYGIALALCIVSMTGWYRVSNNPRWGNDYTPLNIGELKNFNYAQRTLIDQVEKLRLKDAIVFIAPSDNWWTYGVTSTFMDLSFRDNVIYALDLGDVLNKKLFERYPGRKAYQGDYYTGEIIQYSP
ncbi:glycosyltransferase family 39 protein [Candidatus Roizmanbacteria bacterium]|nr:glycosyltransferase family 39 protein [Candidatus Roizmanbacteria bacterium]